MRTLGKLQLCREKRAALIDSMRKGLITARPLCSKRRRKHKRATMQMATGKKKKLLPKKRFIATHNLSQYIKLQGFIPSAWLRTCCCLTRGKIGMTGLLAFANVHTIK